MSTIKGFIDDGIGNISEVTLRVPAQNTGSEQVLSRIDELKQIHVLNNRYNVNDKMIIGRMWHSRYPVGYTRFLDQMDELDTVSIPAFENKLACFNYTNTITNLKYDTDTGVLSEYIPTTTDTGSGNSEITDPNGGIAVVKNGEIVLHSGNFQIKHTDKPILVENPIYLIDANLFLNGCQLWLHGDGKLVCSGNTSVFGGTIRYFDHVASRAKGFIQLMNYSEKVKSSFNFTGLGLTIEFTKEKYERIKLLQNLDPINDSELKISHNIFDCYADYSKIVIDHCNLVLQCDENGFVGTNVTGGVRTISLFHDRNKLPTTSINDKLSNERFSYYVELKNSYIYGQYWHADLAQTNDTTDKENYGISLIYAYGNVAIQNCTFDLDGVDSIINTGFTELRRQTNWKVPNHRFVKITNSKFNILDMTKLFVPAHDLFVLENVLINVGTVRNLNGENNNIKNHVPCLIELNKDPYRTLHKIKQEHIILKDVELNGTIQTEKIEYHSNGFIIRNRTNCGGEEPVACNIKIIYGNDKTLSIGGLGDGKYIEAPKSDDTSGSTWYIEKDPVDSVNSNTNVLVVKKIKYDNNTFVFEEIN